jgi:hypothetical protein
MAGCGRTHRVPVPRWSGRPPATFAGARLQIDASSLDELIVEFAALTGAVAPSQLFPVCVWWSVSLPFVCPMGRTLAWMRASVCVCVHALLTVHRLLCRCWFVRRWRGGALGARTAVVREVCRCGACVYDSEPVCNDGADGTCS